MSHYANLLSGLLGCPQWVLQDLDQTLLDKYVKQAKEDDEQERIQESHRGVYEHLVILNHGHMECFYGCMKIQTPSLDPSYTLTVTKPSPNW